MGKMRSHLVIDKRSQRAEERRKNGCKQEGTEEKKESTAESEPANRNQLILSFEFVPSFLSNEYLLSRTLDRTYRFNDMKYSLWWLSNLTANHNCPLLSGSTSLSSQINPAALQCVLACSGLWVTVLMQFGLAVGWAVEAHLDGDVYLLSNYVKLG